MRSFIVNLRWWFVWFPVVVVAVALFLPVSTMAFTASAAAPRWVVSGYAAPTTFAPNSSGEAFYHVQAHNVGGGATTGVGNVVLADILPPGVTATKVEGVPTSHTNEFRTIKLLKVPCSVKVGVPTCTWAQATLGPVPSDGSLVMTITVNVSAITEGTGLTDAVAVTGGGAPGASTAFQTLVGSANPPFGVDAFAFAATDPAGLPAVQAGAHPYAVTTNLNLSTLLPAGLPEGSVLDTQVPDAGVRDLLVDLPVGLFGDPQAVPRCPEVDLAGSSATCPSASQVGILAPRSNANNSFSETGGGPEVPVYNVVPSGGFPAEIGFNYQQQPVLLFATLRPGDYGLRVVTPGLTRAAALSGAELTVWGVPGEAAHNAQRAMTGGCNSQECTFGATGAVEPRPFLTSPSDCSDAAASAVLYTDSWHDPAPVPLYPEGSPDEGERDFSMADLSEPELVSSQASQPPGVVGCEELSFAPTLTLQPDTARADSPAGMTVDLRVPQNEEPEGLATPPLKSATVTLPEGLVINPSSADGLTGCSAAQAGVGTTVPATCPPASQIGTVTVETPLLEKSLPGEVFLGDPECAPCTSRDAEEGRLVKLYIQVYDRERGVVVKLPGTVTVDPATGRLRATFAQNPQLPFSDLRVAFDKTGPQASSRASLSTPSTCGTYTTTSDLTPWSAPATPDARPTSSFGITQAPGGGRCVSSESEEPNTPGFQAGVLSPVAGSYSPFVLRLTREDGSQTFKALNVTLPPGLLGKVAGVQECSQAGVETAEHTSGRSEQSNPSCPAGSELGTVSVGTGSGAPYYVRGRAFLGGPYKGAPFSLIVITPALAGPFDLGTVVVRSALYIDPATAQVTVKSDPFPSSLAGIPLDIRSVAVSITRTQFTLNPTNCDPLSIAGTLTASSTTAALASPFQVADCASLPFKPSFTTTTSGKTSKANGASLTVEVAQHLGEANIHKVDLQLPLVLPARLTTLQKACTAIQFATNPAGCPEASVIGTATAGTPLLNSPLTGPAYLVSHGGAAFPDVEFVLQGEGVEIVLDGATDIKKGITYSRFETVPDAPISTFETILPEGPHSALAANANLCAPTRTVTARKKIVVRRNGRPVHVVRLVKTRVPETLTMPTTITAQDGATLTQATKILVTGCPKPKGKTKPSGKKQKKGG